MMVQPVGRAGSAGCREHPREGGPALACNMAFWPRVEWALTVGPDWDFPPSAWEAVAQTKVCATAPQGPGHLLRIDAS